MLRAAAAKEKHEISFHPTALLFLHSKKQLRFGDLRLYVVHSIKNYVIEKTAFT